MTGKFQGLALFVTVLYFVDLAEETCLIPQPEGENERLQPEENYNFMSECFYMTHRCINLGLIILLVFTKCIMKSHIRENVYPLDGTLSRKDIIMFHFNNFDKNAFFIKQVYCISSTGMHVVLERLMKLNQELHRIQAIYQDVVRQGGEDSNTGVRIKQQMEKGIYYYCLCLMLSASYILVTHVHLLIL